MTFSTTIPNLTGAIAPTSVTLPSGETVLAIGSAYLGTIAQVSGFAAGFNVFTPTTNAPYHLIITGRDAASGAPTNAFRDVIAFDAATGWTPAVISSTTITGAPGARTWSNNTGALKLVVASGTTWYIDTITIRFAA